MAEHDVGGNLVNARPPDLAMVLCEGSELLNLRAISPDLRKGASKASACVVSSSANGRSKRFLACAFKASRPIRHSCCRSGSEDPIKKSRNSGAPVSSAPAAP